MSSDAILLLTGATEGIGKAAALALARPGRHLVLVGRNPEKLARVEAEVGARGAVVSTLVGDLSLQAGVQAVAEAFVARHDRLDVLANNAGAVHLDYLETAEGVEITFALNHLAYFQLTYRLRALLRPGSRVVVTASGAHRQAAVTEATVGNLVRRPARTAGFVAYADSKLANIHFAREAALRLPGVEVNAYHPGWVGSGFGGNNQGLLGRTITTAGRYLARTPEQGADTLVWLATGEVGATGGYFKDRKPGRLSAKGRDDGLSRAIWAETERVSGLRWPPAT